MTESSTVADRYRVAALTSLGRHSCCPDCPGLIVNLLSEIFRGRLGEAAGFIGRRMRPQRHLDDCVEGVHPVRRHTCSLQLDHQAPRRVRRPGLSAYSARASGLRTTPKRTRATASPWTSPSDVNRGGAGLVDRSGCRPHPGGSRGVPWEPPAGDGGDADQGLGEAGEAGTCLSPACPPSVRSPSDRSVPGTLASSGAPASSLPGKRSRSTVSSVRGPAAVVTTHTR